MLYEVITQECCHCVLRKSAIMTYSEGVEYYKNRVQREFFMKNGKKVMKYFQFSTRRITFNQDLYVLLIIEDLTELVGKDEHIRQQQELIRKLKSESACR